MKNKTYFYYSATQAQDVLSQQDELNTINGRQYTTVYDHLIESTSLSDLILVDIVEDFDFYGFMLNGKVTIGRLFENPLNQFYDDY